MRLVSLDIDPQNRSNRIHLGPFVAGLNAVSGPRGSGKSTIAKFIRGLLYHRHRDSSGYGQEAVDGLVGSLQWADTAGMTRVISSADSSSQRDYCIDGPYHFGRQESSRIDAAYPQSTSQEQPWHRIGGEIYDAVFCGRLGETLPERLWQAARELGIHVATGNQHDETYRRLKAEQHRLEQRLHHLRVDDRDRAWWAAERERLVRRSDEIRTNPEVHVLPGVAVGATVAAHGRWSEPEAYRAWESELIALRAELSEIEARQAEIDRNHHTHHNNGEATSSFDGDSVPPPAYGRYTRSTTFQSDPYGTWFGYSKQRPAPRATTIDHEQSHRDQEAILGRKAIVLGLIADLETKLSSRRSTVTHRATAAWELEELQQRVRYAEEVLKSWDLYETTRQRLAEVQQQLRGHGPYQEAVQGSFLHTVERYIRELSAGSLRRLPTWALEALRRDLGYAAGLSQSGRAESYREVYRDYRPDLNRLDHAVPPSQSSERQLVELAIRMAILDSASHRIGRLPLILDDALDGFHGATLDHLVRVLIEFAREGQQVLLMTSEPEVAQRVRVHHGWVAHLNETMSNNATSVYHTTSYVEPVRYATLAPAAYDGVRHYEPSYSDINAQLAAVAEDSATPPAYSIWENRRVVTPAAPTSVYRFTDYPRPPESRVVPTVRRTVLPSTNSVATYYLSATSPIEDGPGMAGSLAATLRSLGINTVGSFIEADPRTIASRIGGSAATYEQMVARQAEQRLMCTVPNLRAFDARILVGCGLYDAASLTAMHPGRLLKTVEQFLTTSQGQDILRSGSSYEISRMTTWLASAGRSVSRHVVERESSQGRTHRDRSQRRPLKRRRSQRLQRSEPSIQAIASTTRPQRPQVKSASREQVRTTISSSSAGHRFYLDLDSPVVDAPSIGPRMAERLQPLGIITVSHLLRANATSLANQLADKRITASTITEWQHQATLVCRIPNLRGHDAQMLVASGITTAEQVASADANSLYQSVAAFASSKAGQRLLRGSEGADAAEVQDWIDWASNSRVIRAA